MDEKDRDTQEFSLEDILKEFGSGKTRPQPQPDPEPETETEAPSPQVPEGDTIRMEPVPREPELQQTRRLDDRQLSELARQEPAAQPAAEEPEPADAPDAPDPQPPEADPLAPGWEPEYEQPIADYVPPEPIVFRPQSRIKELKRKLTEGPERRYYDLSELGLGKLQLAIVCTLLLTLLSGATVGLYQLGVISAARIRLVVYSQVLALLLAALLGVFRMMDGVIDIFRKKFSFDSLLTVTFLLCLADGIAGLKNLQIPFCAAFCLEMTMSLWAQYQRRNTEMGQMDTLRKATRLDGIVRTEELYEGRPGFQRSQGEVEDFMDHYTDPSGPERALRIYALCALAAAVLVGGAAGFLHGWAFGIHAAAAALLAASPASVFITLSRPMAVLEKRLHRLGSVLCGWRGVEGMCGSACVPVGDADLFPEGTVKLNGVKFFGTRDPDQVVAYGTALIAAEGGGLTPIFDGLLTSRNGRHYDVENLRSYGSGGLGGEVCGEPVLVGVLPFMREIGVDMPEGTRVNQAVYVAIDGELCGVFAITYGKTPSSAAGLTTLCGYRHLMPVLTSRDFMLTESFLRSKFGVNTRRIEFPDRATRFALSQRTPDPQAPVLALTTREGLAPAAFAITGARALRTASRLGAGLHILAGTLGVALVAVLSVLGSADLLSSVNLLLYELVWLVPGLLITEWTRSV